VLVDYSPEDGHDGHAYQGEADDFQTVSYRSGVCDNGAKSRSLLMFEFRAGSADHESTGHGEQQKLFQGATFHPAAGLMVFEQRNHVLCLNGWLVDTTKPGGVPGS